ncbi:MAG: hypothetical protein AAB877_01915 [Patescibacteria group bacterium]
MGTAQEKLDEFIEDIQLTFPSLNCEVLINHIKNVKQEYADEKVKNFNSLPNGSNLPVSGNEANQKENKKDGEVALPLSKDFNDWIREFTNFTIEEMFEKYKIESGNDR